MVFLSHNLFFLSSKATISLWMSESTTRQWSITIYLKIYIDFLSVIHFTHMVLSFGEGDLQTQDNQVTQVEREPFDKCHQI